MNSNRNLQKQEASQWNDGEISLVDTVRSVSRFMKARRNVIFIIWLLSLSIGVLGAFVFNPILVEVRIKNDASRIEPPKTESQKNENMQNDNRNVISFFKLESFRTLQLSLIAALENRSIRNLDAIALERVKLKLKTQNWINENITPEFSISKLDLRSSALPDKAAEVVSQNATLVFLKIANSGPKADEALEEARLMAALCIETALQNQINEFLITQLSNQEAEIKKMTTSMPLVITEITAIEQKLTILKRLKDTYPSDNADQRTTQLTISNMVDSAADQTKFLPLSTQVTGFEIELGIKRSELDQATFKKKAAETFLIKIQQALQMLRNEKNADNSYAMIFDRNYWLTLEKSDGSESAADIIASDYYKSLIEPLRFQLQTLKKRADLIGGQTLFIDERPLYSRSILIFVSIFIGFSLLFILFAYDGVVRQLRPAN